MLQYITLLPLQVPEAVGAEELDSAVDQLSRSSIELAEAAANFGALKVIFGIFLVFTIVMVLFFVYQMLTMTKKVNDIHGSCQNVSKMVEQTANRTLGKPQASILVRRAYNEFAQSLKYFILRSRIENHLDQKEYIASKITKLVNSEYQELSSFLMNYVCDEKTLATHVNLEDSKIIIDFVLEQLYLEEPVFTVASMDQATEILVKGLRLEALKGIE